MSHGTVRKAVLVALASFALGAPPVSAQQLGRVTGTVTDAQSGAALSEVQVFLVDAQLGALSRANGRYLILNVPAGTYQVRAQRIGMSTQTVTVTFPAQWDPKLGIHVT